MTKRIFQADFDMESGEGVLDLGVRINTNTGHFEFIVEENGIPVTIPYYQFIGLITMISGHATYRFYNGYPDNEN